MRFAIENRTARRVILGLLLVHAVLIGGMVMRQSSTRAPVTLMLAFNTAGLLAPLIVSTARRDLLRGAALIAAHAALALASSWLFGGHPSEQSFAWLCGPVQGMAVYLCIMAARLHRLKLAYVLAVLAPMAMWLVPEYGGLLYLVSILAALAWFCRRLLVPPQPEHQA